MEDYYFPNSSGTAGYVVEAGFPGHAVPVPRNPSSPPPRIRRASRGNADAGGELLLHHHHYLDACFRCGRHLGENKDIFMYRGDNPFCSDECRQQQIEADEARERRPSRQQPAAATTKREAEPERERERQRQSSSPQRIPLWAR